MKKIIGISIIVMSITVSFALIPLLIFGNDTISRDHGQYLTGTILFFYILIFGVCFLTFDIVTKFKKYTNTELPKVYQSITYILIGSIIFGGLLVLYIPKEMKVCGSYHKEFNTLALLIPIGLGIVTSLILYGNYISKK